jgi:hypothetical protein
MWQHNLNIVLGLVILMVSLVAMGMHALAPLMTLVFGLLGVLVSMAALGGCFACIAQQPHLDPSKGDV